MHDNLSSFQQDIVAQIRKIIAWLYNQQHFIPESILQLE